MSFIRKNASNLRAFLIRVHFSGTWFNIRDILNNLLQRLLAYDFIGCCSNPYLDTGHGFTVSYGQTKPFKPSSEAFTGRGSCSRAFKDAKNDHSTDHSDCLNSMSSYVFPLDSLIHIQGIVQAQPMCQLQVEV
jgi:hypothetical protein